MPTEATALVVPAAPVAAVVVPTAGGARVAGYDVARGLAILGMVVVRFALVMAAPSAKGPAWLAWVLRQLDGRAAATFVVLAGAGVTLLASRRAGVRAVLCRRAVFLLALGFLNLVVWQGDILRVYGVSLLLAAGLVGVPDRVLLAVAAGFVVGFVALFLFVEYDRNWDWATLTYRHAWEWPGVVRNLFYDGFRSVFPWTGLLVFGMWLGRRDGRSAAVRLRMLVGGAAAWGLAELASRLILRTVRRHWSRLDAETAQALFGTVSMPPLPLFLLSSGGAAVAVIALSVRAAEVGPSAPWLSPLVAMGQMALTWYFFH